MASCTSRPRLDVAGLQRYAEHYKACHYIARKMLCKGSKGFSAKSWRIMMPSDVALLMHAGYEQILQAE